jgi:hypothetical protein
MIDPLVFVWIKADRYRQNLRVIVRQHRPKALQRHRWRPNAKGGQVALEVGPDKVPAPLCTLLV